MSVLETLLGEARSAVLEPLAARLAVCAALNPGTSRDLMVCAEGELLCVELTVHGEPDLSVWTDPPGSYVRSLMYIDEHADLWGQNCYSDRRVWWAELHSASAAGDA